jgi:hypothetical protein
MIPSQLLQVSFTVWGLALRFIYVAGLRRRPRSRQGAHPDLRKSICVYGSSKALLIEIWQLRSLQWFGAVTVAALLLSSWALCVPGHVLTTDFMRGQGRCV